MNDTPKCSGRMLACDQTVQCFDCLRVWWGADYDAFDRDHPAPWELLDDDAVNLPDYGALVAQCDEPPAGTGAYSCACGDIHPRVSP